MDILMEDLTKERQAIQEAALKLITGIEQLPHVGAKEYDFAVKVLGKEIPYELQELIHLIYVIKTPKKTHILCPFKFS